MTDRKLTSNQLKPRRPRWVFWSVLVFILIFAGGGWYVWTTLFLSPVSTPITKNYPLLYQEATLPSGTAKIKDNQLQFSLQSLPRLLGQDVYHAYLVLTEYRTEDKGKITQWERPLRRGAFLLGSFVLDKQGSLLDAKSNKRINSFPVDPTLFQRKPREDYIGYSLSLAASPLDETGQVREAGVQLKGITILSGKLSQPKLEGELKFPLPLERGSGLVEIRDNYLRVSLNELNPAEAEQLGFRYTIWAVKFRGANMLQERELGERKGWHYGGFSISVGIPQDFRDFNRVIISLEPINDPDPSSYDLKPFEARIE